jgi:hypothetical protein
MTDSQSQDRFSFRQAAGADFDEAFRKGFWRAVISWLTKHSNELLPFDEVRKRLPLRGQHYIGLKQVLLDQIIGSVSRYQDFDRAFLPKQTHTRDRWESVDRAHLQDVILPPIELYKLGNVYFVKDGNHRVSVARERGQAYIDANVIEIDVPVSLESDLELHDLVLKQEQAYFYEQTGLQDLHPDANIEFSVPGQYSKLIEHIRVHRWYMGESLQHEISDSEAVDGWYKEVYLPLIKIVRKRNILKEFRGRTEADLYLWIIEHRFYLKEEHKREVSLEKAATHFTKEYSQKPFRHLRNWLRHFIQRIFKHTEEKKK